MNKRTAIVTVAGVVIVAAGWAAFRPELLFVDKTVNESFPGGAATTKVSMSMPATKTASGDATVPTTLASGMFHNGAHDTRGDATIFQLPAGKRVLRLTNFETSNGPDVRVLLIAANDATDDATVKQSAPVELAPLKGNIGDQNYDIPASVDLTKYRAVTIWCNRFGVNFGTAPLAGMKMGS